MSRRAIAALAAATLLVAGASCTRDKGSDEAFCKEIRRTPTLESVVTGFAEADPEELATRLDAARDDYGRLRSSAPSGVRSDVDAPPRGRGRGGGEGGPPATRAPTNRR